MQMPFKHKHRYSLSGFSARSEHSGCRMSLREGRSRELRGGTGHVINRLPVCWQGEIELIPSRKLKQHSICVPVFPRTLATTSSRFSTLGRRESEPGRRPPVRRWCPLSLSIFWIGVAGSCPFITTAINRKKYLSYLWLLVSHQSPRSFVRPLVYSFH